MTTLPLYNQHFIHSSTYLTYFVFFFFNDTATTEIYTLSLHDALPILRASLCSRVRRGHAARSVEARCDHYPAAETRSEEHTSELQSRRDLVCRLLLEKKKKKYTSIIHRPNIYTMATTTTNFAPQPYKA